MHRHEQITVQINHLTIHLVYANLITERGLADSRICGNAVACPTGEPVGSFDREAEQVSRGLKRPGLLKNHILKIFSHRHELSLGPLARQQRCYFAAHLVKRANHTFPKISHLDHMPTIFSTHRIADLVFIQHKHNGFEFRCHSAWLNNAKVSSTSGGSRIVGMFTCQCSEIRATPTPSSQAFCPMACFLHRCF